MAFSSNGVTSRHDKQQKKVEQECLEAALEEGLRDTFPASRSPPSKSWHG